MIYIALYRTLKIQQHESHEQMRVNSVPWKGYIINITPVLFVLIRPILI